MCRTARAALARLWLHAHLSSSLGVLMGTIGVQLGIRDNTEGFWKMFALHRRHLGIPSVAALGLRRRCGRGAPTPWRPHSARRGALGGGDRRAVGGRDAGRRSCARRRSRAAVCGVGVDGPSTATRRTCARTASTTLGAVPPTSATRGTTRRAQVAGPRGVGDAHGRRSLLDKACIVNSGSMSRWRRCRCTSPAAGAPCPRRADLLRRCGASSNYSRGFRWAAPPARPRVAAAAEEGAAAASRSTRSSPPLTLQAQCSSRRNGSVSSASSRGVRRLPGLQRGGALNPDAALAGSGGGEGAGVTGRVRERSFDKSLRWRRDLVHTDPPIETSSTSKCSSAFGGIAGGAPRARSRALGIELLTCRRACRARALRPPRMTSSSEPKFERRAAVDARVEDRAIIQAACNGLDVVSACWNYTVGNAPRGIADRSPS